MKLVNMNSVLLQCQKDDEIVNLINAINSPSKAVVAVAIILVIGAVLCTFFWGFLRNFRDS